MFCVAAVSTAGYGIILHEDDIVKGYLLDPKKLKFFNAITIVLMPKGDDGKIQDTFDNVDTNAPPNEKISDRKKYDMVRDRFSAVLEAGLPELYYELRKQVSVEDEIDTEDIE